MKRSLGAGEWVRRGLGVAVLLGVALFASGQSASFFSGASFASTDSLEERLLERFAPKPQAIDQKDAAAQTPAVTEARSGASVPTAEALTPIALSDEGEAPSLRGATAWLNSSPLDKADLKGKVVLIDFWTYSCINCLRTLPYVRAWAEKYKDQGLVVIGVHTPEFGFERSIPNVKKSLADLGVAYPVAIDNDYAIWKAFDNRYWPAHYFIDANGRIRHRHFGEGDYAESEEILKRLLTEAGRKGLSNETTSAQNGVGAEAPSDESAVLSPETYIGFARAQHFVSPGGATPNKRHRYETGAPSLNEWGLRGEWTIQGERASLDRDNGAIVYRFHARDLHLVLGPGASGRKARFVVTIDGAPPGASHGADVGADGVGSVTEQRLYQLVRQSGAIADHTFEIKFLDRGVEAYAFTFG